MAVLCYEMYKETKKGRHLYLPMHIVATILRKKHSRRSTPSKYKSRRGQKHVAPVLPSRFVPKSTPENEPLSSYTSATKKKKMEKIEGRANFSLTC